MATKKILVVDDDSAVRTLIRRFLGRQNFQMESAENGEMALAMFKRFQPDLVILDVMLPDIIGFDVCKQIKKERTDVLVMLLSSLTDAQSQINGLEIADAYALKPFHLAVLEKQVQALLRILYPLTPTKQPNLIFGKLMIDPASREVTFDNKLVPLTTLEFDLLYFLAKHSKQAWSRQQLIKEVWGHDFLGEMRVVDVHIGQLRRKIEPNPSQTMFIHTIRSFGYKFSH